MYLFRYKLCHNLSLSVNTSRYNIHLMRLIVNDGDVNSCFPSFGVVTTVLVIANTLHSGP